MWYQNNKVVFEILVNITHAHTRARTHAPQYLIKSLPHRDTINAFEHRDTINAFENRADPDQAAFARAVWSGSTLFAH